MTTKFMDASSYLHICICMQEFSIVLVLQRQRAHTHICDESRIMRIRSDVTVTIKNMCIRNIR